MKLLAILLVLICSQASAQRPGRDDNPVKSGDRLERAFDNVTQFKIITDSLPVYTTDENSGWRDMKLVTYYYLDQNDLKKIMYRNGREGYFYFYYDGPNLIKARITKEGGLVNIQYYFTTNENSLSSMEIDQPGIPTTTKER